MLKSSEEQLYEKKKNEYDKKFREMLVYGMRHRLVFTYSSGVFDRLRSYQVEGLPLSIILFISELCNEKGYDSSMLMQLAFEDCEVVYADIETLRVNFRGDKPEHSFVVTKDFGGNKEWVVDTSMGLIYDKDYYYKFEKPIVNKVYSKAECMEIPEIKKIIMGNFENDEYALPIYLPFIEKYIRSSKWLGTIMYRNKLWDEIDGYKKVIQSGEEKLKECYENSTWQSLEEKKQEDIKISVLAKKRIKEILKNPVANFYDSCLYECVINQNEIMNNKKNSCKKTNK